MRIIFFFLLFLCASCSKEPEIDRNNLNAQEVKCLDTAEEAEAYLTGMKKKIQATELTKETLSNEFNTMLVNLEAFNDALFHCIFQAINKHNGCSSSEISSEEKGQINGLETNHAIFKEKLLSTQHKTQSARALIGVYVKKLKESEENQDLKGLVYRSVKMLENIK